MARPIYAALLGLVLLAGCAGKAQPVVQPETRPTAKPVAPTTDAAPSEDDAAPSEDDAASAGGTTPEDNATADINDNPPGKLACRSLSAAVQAASLMNAGVVDGIVKASATADAPVADAARRLATAYAAAVKAHNTDGEPDAIAAVSMAGAEMTKICQDSGLDAAG